MPNWYPGQNKTGWHVVADPAVFAAGFASQPPAVTAPGTAGPGTAVTNTTGFDCMVYLSAASAVGSVQINGVGVAGTTGGVNTVTGFYVPANQTIAVTYNGALTWRWQAV